MTFSSARETNVGRITCTPMRVAIRLVIIYATMIIVTTATASTGIYDVRLS